MHVFLQGKCTGSEGRHIFTIANIFHMIFAQIHELRRFDGSAVKPHKSI